MTIEPGVAWGERRPLPEGAAVVDSDAAARALVEQARRAGREPGPIGLAGGDLCRTLGGGDPARLRSPEAMSFPVDVGSVLVDGRQHWFVAHLVARRSWWRGRVLAVMNAEWIGPWDVGIRSHPDDGLLDVTDVATTMTVAQRRRARARLATGSHVPHPAIRTWRAASAQLELDPPLDIWLDGERVGRARNLAIRVEPDALTVVV